MRPGSSTRTRPVDELLLACRSVVPRPHFVRCYYVNVFTGVPLNASEMGVMGACERNRADQSLLNTQFKGDFYLTVLL